MPMNFYCELCDFTCCKKSIYDKHLETSKHKRGGYFQIQPGYNDTINIQTEEPPIMDGRYTCIYCMKSYKYHSGLWRHKRECIGNDNEISQTENVVIHKDPRSIDRKTQKQIRTLTAENREIKMKMNMMMRHMIVSNSQFQSQLFEMLKSTNQTLATTQPTHAITSNGDNAIINSNNNNSTFNMNMFLNEKCKDAMNMKDFVNSIQLNLTDLENVGRLGYVEGMSNILIDNLQKTDLYKRPVHCSDVKRETLYVKDDNKWEREGPTHQKMVNAVLAVEHKNVALVSEWAKSHPLSMNSNTRDNEMYMKLSKAATDGEKEGNIAKVIRKVAKRVAVEK